MSRVTCFPGDSMYGKTMTSVAPAPTQSREARGDRRFGELHVCVAHQDGVANHLLEEVRDAGQHVIRLGFAPSRGR